MPNVPFTALTYTCSQSQQLPPTPETQGCTIHPQHSNVATSPQQTVPENTLFREAIVLRH